MYLTTFLAFYMTPLCPFFMILDQNDLVKYFINLILGLVNPKSLYHLHTDSVRVSGRSHVLCKQNTVIIELLFKE